MEIVSNAGAPFLLVCVGLRLEDCEDTGDEYIPHAHISGNGGHPDAYAKICVTSLSFFCRSAELM